MKKIFSLFAAVLFAFAANAQGTDFAAPGYSCAADDAVISGDAPASKVFLDETADPHHIAWSDVSKSYTAVASWAVTATRACYVSVSLDLGPTISSNKHIFEVKVLDADMHEVGVLEEGPAYTGDGFTEANQVKALTGKIMIPAAGTYTVELRNNRDFCKGSIKNVILTYAGDAPVTDFAAPGYSCTADDATISGDAPSNKVFLDESTDSHHIGWSDVSKSYTVVVSWKILATRACYVSASLDLGPAISSNKHIFELKILDADGNEMGAVEEGPAYTGDGFTEANQVKALDGTILVPKAGEYTIELRNNRDFCKGSIKNVILKYAADAPAEPKTIYCKVLQSWWTNSGAAVGIYAWGEGVDAIATWPGVRMEKVEGQPGVWKYDLPAQYTYVIFTRVNPSDQGDLNWGAKTGNLTVPADDKDLFTITSTAEVWGDPGATGEWSVYGEEPEPVNPIADTYFATGSGWADDEESSAVWDADNQKITVSIKQDKIAQWQAQIKYQGPATEYGRFYHVGLKLKANNAVSGVTIKWEENTGILMENASVTLQEGIEYTYNVASVQASLEGGNGILVLDFGQAKAGDIIDIYDVVIEEVEAPAVTLEDGYYLIGLNGWTIYNLTAADKFVASDTEGEFKLEGVTLGNGDEFKVVTVANNALGAWFPGDAGNYVVDLAHAGENKPIYFRPNYNGNEDWHAACIFVPANDEPVNPITFTFFADPSWTQEEQSTAVWDADNEKITVSIAVDKAQQWQAQVMFQATAPEAGKWYRFSVKMKANNDLSGITVKYSDNAEMFYNNAVELKAGVELEFVKVVPGLAGSGIIVYDFGYAKAGDVIEIYDLSVEEIDAPALNYYVAGTINDWAIADDQYEFEANEQAEGEFIAHAELAAGAEFKVVSVQGDHVVWFPGDANYVVDEAHAGKVTIYFRPAYDGGEGWHAGCIYVEKDKATAIDNTDTEVKAVKVIENGQIFIIRGGEKFNAQGQAVR